MPNAGTTILDYNADVTARVLHVHEVQQSRRRTGRIESGADCLLDELPAYRGPE